MRRMAGLFMIPATLAVLALILFGGCGDEDKSDNNNPVATQYHTFSLTNNTDYGTKQLTRMAVIPQAGGDTVSVTFLCNLNETKEVPCATPATASRPSPAPPKPAVRDRETSPEGERPRSGLSGPSFAIPAGLAVCLSQTQRNIIPIIGRWENEGAGQADMAKQDLEWPQRWLRINRKTLPVFYLRPPRWRASARGCGVPWPASAREGR